MNVLIVNAFGNSPSGKLKFNYFFALIKKIFKKVSENSGIDNFNYIIRNPMTLEDYTFNYYSNPTDETSETQNRKNFNSLDMIFIDGIEMYSPWKKRSHSLAKFLELCKLSNKVLYAGGVALEILIYYLSIGSINEYNIINSKGEIKAIEELNQISSQFLKGLKKNEIFLDFVTGDLLEYRNHEKLWEPIMNIGLHHQISAEKYYSRGKFVLNDKFKGKDYNKNESAMNTFCYEIKVKITRQYVSHYLVQNCPIEFIAISSLEWFPHFVNVTAKKLQFKTICQSIKGPLVIEHENTIGVAFHSQEKCKDSVKILENFIKKKFNEVKDKLLKIKNIKIIINESNKEISPVFKIFKANDDKLKGKFDPDEEIPNNPYSLLGKVTNSCLFNRTKKVKHEAKHVGQSINNREMIFVENNYINQRTFFRIKSKKIEKNNNKKENNKNINVKNFSSTNKIKRESFISNSSRGNKSLNSINSMSNRNQSHDIKKRVMTTVKRRKKKIKDLKEINDFNSLNEFDKKIHLKLKTFNYNSNMEKSKNDETEENNKYLLLRKLLTNKVANNEPNNEPGLEKDKEKDEEGMTDFHNYESKYPRLPTLKELGNIFNTNNLRTKSFDFHKNMGSKIINNKLSDNESKDNGTGYNEALFLKRLSNKNSITNNNKDITNNNKKIIFNSKYGKNNFEENNKCVNSKYSVNNSYRPIINKNYNIANRF
jgi:hypothetical protein